MDIILITGMSGSGKSVALHALEDAGYYCVDNLPPELLIPFVKLEQQQKEQRLAIAIDVRSANSLHLLPEQMALLRAAGVDPERALAALKAMPVTSVAAGGAATLMLTRNCKNLKALADSLVKA